METSYGLFKFGNNINAVVDPTKETVLFPERTNVSFFLCVCAFCSPFRKPGMFSRFYVYSCVCLSWSCSL